MKYRDYNKDPDAPSEKTLRKIRQSMLEAKSIEIRNLKCPVCGFKAAEIPAYAKIWFMSIAENVNLKVRYHWHTFTESR